MIRYKVLDLVLANKQKRFGIMPVSLIVVIGIFAIVGAIAGFGSAYAFGDLATKSKFNLKAALKTDKFSWCVLSAVAGAILGSIAWSIFTLVPQVVTAVIILVVGLVVLAVTKTIIGVKQEGVTAQAHREIDKKAKQYALDLKQCAFDIKREKEYEKANR
jgi:NAD/NADP transhydrogenase beta subunit